MRSVTIYTIVIVIIILTHILHENKPNKYIPKQRVEVANFVLKQYSPTCWYVANQLLFKMDDCSGYELGSYFTFVGNIAVPTDNSLKDLNLLELSEVKMTAVPSQLAWYEPKFIQSRLFQIRENLHQRLRLILPKQDAELYFSLLFGGSAFLPEETKQAIVYLGIQHIMAASGMQVNLLLFLFLPLEKLLPKKLGLMFRLSYLLFYAQMAMMSVSIVRAVFQSMLGTFLLVKFQQNSYSWSLLLILLFFLVTDISDSRVALQLTILAVTGLQFRQFITRVTHWRVRQQKLKLSKLNIAIKYIKEGLITTVWVQIWLFPFLTYYFKQVSSMSIVATLAIAWLLAPLFALGIVAVGIISFLPITILQSVPVLILCLPLYLGTWLLRPLISLMESIVLPPISINTSAALLISWYLCLLMLFWWFDARWLAQVHSNDLKIIRKKY